MKQRVGEQQAIKNTAVGRLNEDSLAVLAVCLASDSCDMGFGRWRCEMGTSTRLVPAA